MPGNTAASSIDTMTRNREQFERFCSSLSDEELGRLVPQSHWTVQDFIIHLLTFDDLMTRWVEGVRAGTLNAALVNSDGQRFDIDAWNNRRVAEWRDRPLADLFAEAEAERAHFVAGLEALTDEQLQQVMEFPGDNKRDPGKVPLGLFVSGLARHDPIHVADILKALPERADDPDLRAWLDDRMVQWYQQAMSGPPKR